MHFIPEILLLSSRQQEVPFVLSYLVKKIGLPWESRVNFRTVKKTGSTGINYRAQKDSLFSPLV